jgi:transcriptional regulator with XRE-family HTH domain
MVRLMATTAKAHKLLTGWLDSKKLTQRELARVFGVSPATATYWCNGEGRPSHMRALAIEAWTEGAVPASSWFGAQEQTEFERLAAIGPFRP